MRRHRPTHYSLAFLTIAVGIAAAPAAVSADDGIDAAAPADAATTPPRPTPPTPAAPTDEPPAGPPTTQAPPPETAVPTTDPAPPVTTSDRPPAPDEPTPTTTDPATTPDPAGATTAPPAASPTTSEPAQAPAARTGESGPADDDELDSELSAAPADEHIVRPIAFPVLGTVHYGNDWGNCRDGCTRRHQGTDMLGVRMQPLLAAVDGTVTRIRYENVGTAGSVISITGADGWYYNYFHVNDDTPGTDDGLAGHEWQISPHLAVGSTVRAGEVIGYMGDSGNAEGSVPHLHFEIRRPDRTPVNPYHSLAAAQQHETCQPLDAVAWTDPVELSPAVVAVIPIDGGGRWLIDVDGRLFAEGPAAHVAPATSMDCAVTPAPDVAPRLNVATATPAPAPLLTASTPAMPAMPAMPAAAVPSSMTWTVERGQSLWEIAQEAYGVSDTAATVSLVNLMVANNRDVVSDPDVIRIGMTLQLPPRD